MPQEVVLDSRLDCWPETPDFTERKCRRRLSNCAHVPEGGRDRSGSARVSGRLMSTVKIDVAFQSIFVVLAGALALAAAEAKPSSQNGFNFVAVGQVPDDMLVLDGGFAVKEEGGNKFLELPGAPLETYGVLFGPTEGSGLSVSARIQGTSQGRRFPTFGVGLNGVG